MMAYEFWHAGPGCPAGETLHSTEPEWEQFGFSCDEDGNPRRDCNGNTVTDHILRLLEITPSQAWELYAGEGSIPEPRDRGAFERWAGERVSDAAWAELCGEEVQ